MFLTEVERKDVFRDFFTSGEEWTEGLKEQVLQNPDLLDNYFQIYGLASVIMQTCNVAEWRVCATEHELAGGIPVRKTGFDLTIGTGESEINLRYLPNIQERRIVISNLDRTMLHFFDQKITSCAHKNGCIVFYFSEPIQISISPRKVEIKLSKIKKTKENCDSASGQTQAVF